LIKKGFAQIDSVKWLHACEQVKHSIEQMIWKSDAIQEEIEEIIINLDSDIDSDSDSDEMSDHQLCIPLLNFPIAYNSGFLALLLKFIMFFCQPIHHVTFS
jgi:hypothetical protein